MLNRVQSHLRKFFEVGEEKDVFSLILLNGTVLLYSFAFWLSRLTIPYLFLSIKASPIIFGYYEALYALIQLLGLRISKEVSINCDTKLALQLGNLGFLISFLLLGFSKNLLLLFCSAIPLLLSHNLTISRNLAIILSKRENEQRALTTITLSNTLGTILGSLFSGFLLPSLGFLVVFLCSGLLVLLNMILIGVLLPKKVYVRPYNDTTFTSKLPDLPHVIKQPDANFLLSCLASLSLTLFMFKTAGVMYLVTELLAPPEVVGVISAMGALLGFIAKHFTATNQFYRLTLCEATTVLIFGLLLFFPAKIPVYAGLMFFALISTGVSTSLSLLIAACRVEGKHTLFELAHSAVHLSCICAPALASLLLSFGGFQYVCLVGGLLGLASLLKTLSFESTFEYSESEHSFNFNGYFPTGVVFNFI
ncbi:uncharacterized protein LOC135122280 [Zophobas morio]|uniref:uncharacterized protein LOC135122280 n=1 Tax=Zophobas morio TaxID=2755281 RepID=UPI00308346FE